MLKKIIRNILGIPKKNEVKNNQSRIVLTKVNEVSSLSAEKKLSDLYQIDISILEAQQIELFRPYRKGIIKDIEQFITICLKDKENKYQFIIFDKGHDIYYSSGSVGAINQKLKGLGANMSTIKLLDKNRFYHVSTGGLNDFENIIPSHFDVAINSFGYYDRNVEVKLFKNLKYRQLELELKKRGIRQE